jgi:hypothetical protein
MSCIQEMTYGYLFVDELIEAGTERPLDVDGMLCIQEMTYGYLPINLK